MKKLYTLILLSLIISVANAQNVRTSVMSGVATNPLVWDCICIPLPGDSIIINHNIILNNDFGYLSGAVVINASGSLVGDNPMRSFAFAGTGRLNNHGVFNVARVALASGFAINTGNFMADSLYSGITGAGFQNSNYMEIQTSFWNTGTFKNSVPTSQLVVRDNFYNGDSLISGVNAVLVNDGKIRVNLDFANSDTLRGSGQICVDGNSLNIGIITGTLDFCDLGSGSIDANWGTITGGVQFCQAECQVNIDESLMLKFVAYPNPATDNIVFTSEVPFGLTIMDISGKLMFQSSMPLGIQSVDLTGWASGIYIYYAGFGDSFRSGKLVVADR